MFNVNVTSMIFIKKNTSNFRNLFIYRYLTAKINTTFPCLIRLSCIIIK